MNRKNLRKIAICDNDEDILNLITKTCDLYFKDKEIVVKIDRFK